MVRGSRRRLAPPVAAVVLVLGAAGCDRMPLVAPTNSTVTLTSGARILPTGGATEVSAFVAEQSGTPVHNGTVVRFSTNLGRVDPVEAQTTNGTAFTTFHAGDVSGVADIRATSGSAGGGATGAGGGAGAATATNVVQITVGAAAVETVVLRANPASVPATGGASELVATVVGIGSRALQGVSVTFSASEGQLSSGRVTTDEYGEGRTVLVTDRTATVTASAGTKTSNTVTITRRDPLPTPSVTLSAALGTSNLIGQQWNFTATVTGTDASSLPIRYDWNFGNGVTATTNGNTYSYVYTDRGVVRRVTVQVTLANGQTISAATEIIVTN